MNPWQMAQQLKHLLSTVTWPEGSQDVVFGLFGVHVFAGSPTEEQIPPRFPWVLVGIEGGEPDEDTPQLLTQRFTLISACDVAGDPLGEQAILGGSVADLGKSVGRGVAEIAERVRAAVEDLTGADGAQVLVTSTSTAAPATLGRGRHLVLDELGLEAVCTSALHYSAPQVLAHDGSDWTWEGAHVSDRFDFLQYRIVRKAGTSPSTDPSDGTTVYTGPTATFTGAASSGQTYTVFADYNARGRTTVEDSSEPEVGAYVVVS